MDPKPFAYEHFIQTVQSLKDDMLMYYIDEAVAIYCRIKGKSVGPVLPVPRITSRSTPTPLRRPTMLSSSLPIK